MRRTPVAVIVISLLLISAGTFGFLSHLTEFRTPDGVHYDALWAALTGAAAILAGVLMLRRKSWARWLAMAWIAFHVILSAFHSWQETAVHALICAAFAFFLFRPSANRRFTAASE